VSFGAITLCVASHRVFIDDDHFIIDSVRKLNFPTYLKNLQVDSRCFATVLVSEYKFLWCTSNFKFFIVSDNCVVGIYP
jgi:hypothetical protein